MKHLSEFVKNVKVKSTLRTGVHVTTALKALVRRCAHIGLIQARKARERRASCELKGPWSRMQLFLFILLESHQSADGDI